MKTTYVVTGGAGFIGSHLAERLLREGYTVRVVDNLVSGKRANLKALQALGGDLSIHEVSAADAEAMKPILCGAEVVFHQAALPSVPRSLNDPLETHLHGATATLTVLDVARRVGVRRVVYAASSSAYGEQEPDHPKHEDMKPAPISPYGVAKLVGEYYAQAFTASFGLETVCLRYFNVFGPRQDPTSLYAAVIPKFIQAMLRGEAPVIYGDGQQSRDFTYIDNVVHGNLLAADAPQASGQVVNLATGGRINLLNLVDKLNALLGTNIYPQFAPPRAGDILHSQASIEKAGRLLGYEPLVSFDEGLARTLAWYREQR
ncbi:MAG: NAD-dependent epimerase/dehydratase family protein [Anaerolineae bacterium]|nr:NAD-dependent epimerase/dehydratase family protein [Anaerolineae bacterium]MDW8173970.1 NAD-dependent epimerase/dehydratase family protein [Anaerolineae bacterium]